MIFVVMGVSGCGKTTLGRALSEKLNIPFFDGDDWHSAGNRDKLSRGEPLADADRLPWLATLHELLKENTPETGGTGCVLACSALKGTYREILTGGEPECKEGGLPDIFFIYLKGDREIIRGQLEKREGHFMPVSLLDSQFADLEEPEKALVLSVSEPLQDKINRVLNLPGVRS